jgi:hypothetical protein
MLHHERALRFDQRLLGKSREQIRVGMGLGGLRR